VEGEGGWRGWVGGFDVRTCHTHIALGVDTIVVPVSSLMKGSSERFPILLYVICGHNTMVQNCKPERKSRILLNVVVSLCQNKVEA